MGCEPGQCNKTSIPEGIFIVAPTKSKEALLAIFQTWFVNGMMAGKGFNIEKQCMTHNITLYIPPVKQRSYQIFRH